jgi:Putative zinc-finger
MRRQERPGRVNQTMGTTMDNPACEWVRGRLPLCMVAGDDTDDPGDERGDLSVEDRTAIDRHLGTCPACRAHQSALARALGALGLAATATPLADTPSLWPALERRIASHHARDRSRKSRSRAQDGATERERTCAALNGDRPLRSAWMQDTLKEGLGAVWLGALSGRPTGTARPGRSGRSARVLQGPRLIVWTSVAASILAVLVLVPAWQRQADAQARILAYAAPIPGLIVPAAEPQPEAQDIAEATPEDDRVVPGGQLAQAELIRPSADPVPTPARAADATSGTRSMAPTRFSFDLEPLTPMPPEGRDAKSVY